MVLRWHIQHRSVLIPSTTDPEQMAANFDLFGFDLSAAEVAAIDGLDRGERGRRGPHPDTLSAIL